MSSTASKPVFTEHIAAGKSTYFFEVEIGKEGTKYLVIGESKHTEFGIDHQRIVITEQTAAIFSGCLTRAIAALGEERKLTSFDKIRQVYSRAYHSWTPAEDEQLRVSYKQGASIDDMAKSLKRQIGAVRSRLAKLGLAVKFP